jgi:hypothetical protein
VLVQVHVKGQLLQLLPVPQALAQHVLLQHVLANV